MHVIREHNSISIHDNYTFFLFARGVSTFGFRFFFSLLLLLLLLLLLMSLDAEITDPSVDVSVQNMSNTTSPFRKHPASLVTRCCRCLSCKGQAYIRLPL